VVIATPGRLVDHLENTKGFNLRTVRYLILDEVSRFLYGGGSSSGGGGGGGMSMTLFLCPPSGGSYAVNGL